MDGKRSVVLSGMRPTGRMHLGNFEGALKNWVELQEEYEAYYFVADLHALTTAYSDTTDIPYNIREMVLDWLAAGLDPDRCTIFIQSQVKEHAELHLLFSFITPTPWLIRNPTIKEQARDLGKIGEGEGVEKIEYGFLGYPVLQAADILLYKADKVPVGEDQKAHIEMARAIARRFNNLYRPIFPEPTPKLTYFCRLPGLDGNRMSKSLGNTIQLTEEPSEVRRKIFSMFTDPAKIRRSDPGHPYGCVVFNYHQIYTARESVASIETRCRTGRTGCVDCKEQLTGNMVASLAPIRERREELKKRPDIVDEVLMAGCERARRIAEETMNEVRNAMNILAFKKQESRVFSGTL